MFEQLEAKNFEYLGDNEVQFPESSSQEKLLMDKRIQRHKLTYLKS
jgi:hypothetical protein